MSGYKRKPERLRGARISREERMRLDAMRAKGIPLPLIAQTMGLALATVTALLAGEVAARSEADGRHGGMR